MSQSQRAHGVAAAPPPAPERGNKTLGRRKVYKSSTRERGGEAGRKGGREGEVVGEETVGERLSVIRLSLGGQIAIYSLPVVVSPAARMASNETEFDQVASVFLERSHLSHWPSLTSFCIVPPPFSACPICICKPPLHPAS
ncbi:unnamed protein product [Pleuronectes platessa]|uniref:Uncharacterized protein n=1 Tax=Pleuronectes platessa TaxID=8262 RepID=A0A9N7W0R5_PLEPL|nr:unnamed protein product [Pleuronectes platessa]